MKEITKEEQRDVQLGLMSYIDKVCREQDIEYSISAGTLLGSVKYKGYIPWDDDIDMMLTRPNYERLMEALMQGLPKHFTLLYYKNHTAYLPFAKLYDNRTYFVSESDTLNKGTGLFIDIFPLDSLPEDKVKGEHFKKKVRTAVTKLVSSAPSGLSYASSENRIYFFAKSLLWLPYHLRYKGRSRVLAERVDVLMQKYNDEEHKFCNFVWSPPKKTAYFDKGIFTEYEDIDFEHLKLKKIKNHDVYLSELYGDWRNPPKKEQYVTTVTIDGIGKIKMTKTAVLVATYNGEKILQKQLDTIREQELKPDFVLFRDDRSTDNTVAFLKDYIAKYNLENWIIKINDVNIGWRLNFRQLLVDTLNYDIDIAFFSDQDNIWHLDKNLRQVRVMEEHPEMELLSADIEVKKVSEDVADLPRWFTYFKFEQNQEFSKYPLRFGYSSYRVGWVVGMRRKFIADIVKYWKPEYNITHDVLVAALSSLTETGYNLNHVVGTHLLHDSNATGDRLLTVHSPKQVHVDELYKFVGFYDVMYHVLQERGSNHAPRVKAYYDFYVKRHSMARDNKFWSVLMQIVKDWNYYDGMSGRLRDILFAFKR